MDLLEVQGTLKSLLQHHSSKASILQCSAFFIVQLSHSYMTTGSHLRSLSGIDPPFIFIPRALCFGHFSIVYFIPPHMSAWVVSMTIVAEKVFSLMDSRVPSFPLWPTFKTRILIPGAGMTVSK